MDFNKFEAIVIIDELGSHLHPRWKMRIVSALREAFSKMQFWVTSHEPLCLRGVKKGEPKVVLYDFQKNDVELIDEDLPDPSEYKIEQLLTSNFFGLYTTIDPEDEAVFNLYYELLRKESDGVLSTTEKPELVKLRGEIMAKSHLGDTLREELIYHAVDHLLATKNTRRRIDELKKEATANVEYFWKTYDMPDLAK